jgi:hypothetical protein
MTYRQKDTPFMGLPFSPAAEHPLLQVRIHKGERLPMA